MREIQRTIVSGLIFSKDGNLLMGRKDPTKGGVYGDCWHLPGGGVDEGESLVEALRREVLEETGINISLMHLESIDIVGSGTAEKVLKETGEKVLCHMEFNRFEIHLEQNAEDVHFALGDDLIEVRWFTRDELGGVQQIPGGKEFFQQMGYMT